MDNVLVAVLEKTIENGLKSREKKGDYRNSEGILMCGVCHMPKEKIWNPTGKNSELVEHFRGRKMWTQCQCDIEKRRAEELSDKQRRIWEIRKSAITDKNYLRYNFAGDDGENLAVSNACKKYAENFGKMLQNGTGLMFCGHVGTGKTFYAGCIANAVIDKLYSVYMTNIPNLVDRMGYGQEEKMHVLNIISHVSLLVLDDFGIERDTPYSMEKLYEIINTRYQSNKPLIITTNMSVREMRNQENISYKRICDRILQMCHPIAVTGQSRRQKDAEARKESMNKFLGLN